MAQRTAFLNSDAKWFNKDFHHTWVENYMIKQPWVLFSNYSTKPEFALGNWQIAWGKAIIRCTRTTGTFAWEEILASFESTTTENISTSWNKKVFIEIPEVYVNDSTSITDTLTQWVNLWVWRIVSDSDYPSHSNYIPLWEITWWDWENAVDKRPEILKRWKPNTLSYYWGNGEEGRIAIDNSSLNKYLMSNWAWAAPTWEEWGGSGGWSWENFKRTFTADVTLSAKSMFWIAKAPWVNDADLSIDIWKYSWQTKNAFAVVLNWESFSSLSLKMSAVNSPADTVTVRIETVDSDWKPTGTLIDVWAYWTATPTSEAWSVTFNLASEVSWITAHTKAAVVIQRNWSVSSSNYFTLWTCSNKQSYQINKMYVYHSWNDLWSLLWSSTWCADCAWFADEYVLQSAASVYAPSWLWYCETWASAWNDFTWILQGTVDYEGATKWTKYYVNTIDGTLVTYKTSSLVWIWIADWILQIWWVSVNLSWYDAIVDAGWRGNYTTISAAISWWARSILVMPGTYNESEWNEITDSGIVLHWVDKSRTIINITVENSYSMPYFIKIGWTEANRLFVDIRNLTINLTLNKNNWMLVYWYSSSNWQYIDEIIDNCIINITSWVACWWYITYVWLIEENRGVCSNSIINISDNWYYLWLNTNSFWTFENCMFYLSATTARVWLSCSNFNDCIIKWNASDAWWMNLSLKNVNRTSIELRDNQTLHKGRTYINWATDCDIEHNWSAYPSTDISWNTNIPNWQPTTAYSVWDYVWDDYDLLECIEAHTSQSSAPWQDEDKWDYVASITLKWDIKDTRVSQGSWQIRRVLSLYWDNTYYLPKGIEWNNIAYEKIFVWWFTSLENNIIKWPFVQNRWWMTVISWNKIMNSSGNCTLYYSDNYSLIQNNIVSWQSTNWAITVLGTQTNTSSVWTNLLMKANSLS